MRILIAEDEPIARLRLKAQLEKWGYQVVVAKDGEEAWRVLSGDEPPQLAILDWMMPGLDGPEVCRRLRALRSEPYVYVILLSGRGATTDLVAGLDAGADDYMTKPFEAAELQGRLRVGLRVSAMHTELVRAREALRFQAMHDALTGAFNRAAGMDALREEMARTERTGTSVALAMIDLDHFKAVNDTYGHPAGDEVLREAVRRSQRSIRPYDKLARYGGEELMLILPGCDDTTALTVGNRIRECFASTPVLVGAHPIAMTCSVGVAAGGRGTAANELIERADRALYVAKRAGRNRVEVAGAELTLLATG